MDSLAHVASQIRRHTVAMAERGRSCAATRAAERKRQICGVAGQQARSAPGDRHAAQRAAATAENPARQLGAGQRIEAQRDCARTHDEKVRAPGGAQRAKIAFAIVQVAKRGI